MPRVSILLTLAVALLVSRANSQEIVIEPTNGRPASASATNHVSRPAAIEATPAKSATAEPKSAAQQSSAAKKPLKRSSVKAVAAKSKAPAVQTNGANKAQAEPAQSVVMAKNETPAVAPETKKIPVRPQWAVSDTRDPRALQVEISNALAHDPKLASSSIHVNVDDNSVTLEGQASGVEEHLQAQRLAQSYAWNRKLVDHIETVRVVSAQK